MVSAPLYLFSRFFSGKATEHLLGEGIHPEHLNDDCLGRVLDKLFEAGLTRVFVAVALAAAQKLGVETKSVHLDSSSFHVDGESADDEEEDATPELGSGARVVRSAETQSKAIQITYGYSRDHRPDLKQFIVDLMCSADGDVPLYLRVADGNESERAVFAQLFKEFRQQWDVDALFVADAALDTQENRQQMQFLRWLSRVPATLNKLVILLPSEAIFFSFSVLLAADIISFLDLPAECGF